MSRIAGVLDDVADRNNGPAVDASLDAVSANGRWTTRRVRAGPTTFGWSGWHRPGAASDAGVIAVVDGRLYNRNELEPGDSDADVILSLYRKHGMRGALQRLNGDFALALYDERHDTLWLARDRFGIKPLYYSTAGDAALAFASRPGGLLALPGISREPNRRFVALFAAAHYRYFDNRPHESPYADIRQLPAAHVLKMKNGTVEISRYWSLDDLPDFDRPTQELAEEYRALLTDSVVRRYRVSERPAFTLSGGMDSSSVLASAVDQTGDRQDAFSTVYADATYDESDEIATMLDTKVGDWHPVKVGHPDVFSLVEKMVAAHDEPVATATWLSHFLLCAETQDRGYGSLFGGLGGDELNAGEYEYFLFHFADLHHAGRKDELDREVEWWVAYHDHPIFRKNRNVVDEGLNTFVDLAAPGRCRPDPRRLSRYAPALNADYFDLAAFEPELDHPFDSYLKNRTYQDLFRETAPCCLRAEDRQATAFGLDNFLPFLDYRLVEFMYRVPGDLKIRYGVTKVLLREAMRGVLPEETRTRVKKTGWNAPAHQWFSGRGRDDLLDLVHSRAFRERDIYNVDHVERLIDEHEQIVSNGIRVENHMMFLWQLINLESWLHWNY